jgi:two-component system sensor histidine kinase KdpD
MTTVVATALLPYVDLANVVMLFLLAVFLTSVYLGRGAGILAAFLSVALFDFFCVTPRFTFAVDNIQYLLTFAVMLAVALITGQLAANLREQAKLASEREQRTLALYEMARALSGTLQLEQVCEITSTFLRKIAALESVLLLPHLNTLEPASPNELKYEVHMAWAAYENKHQQLLTEPDGLYYLPLKGTTRMRGVLVVASPQNSIDGPPILTDEEKALLTTVASLVAIAIERLHYVDVAKQGELQIATERLRSSILSALSHDLRTPLTVLVGMADSLLGSKPVLSDKQKLTAQTLVDQSKRLSGMVTNLLDMARLHAGEVNIHKEWQPLEEVIGASIQMLEKTLEQHPVKVSLPDDLPLLEFDAVLMERVFCNLLENAAKYSNAGDVIEISAQVQGRFVSVSVCDYGCGIPADKQEAIFGMFVRGQSPEEAKKIAGTGIGLAVCKAIIEAHQGSIVGVNRPSSGACIRFTLPLGEPPLFNEALLVEALT